MDRKYYLYHNLLERIGRLYKANIAYFSEAGALFVVLISQGEDELDYSYIELPTAE